MPPQAPAVPQPPPAPPPPPSPEPAAATPFAHERYHFMSAVRPGEIASVRDDAGHVLFSYRGFASIVGIAAALVSGIVLLAGIAALLFLIAEESPVRAMITLALTIVFSILIAMLVPRTRVTLHDARGPILMITQTSASTFPVARFAVSTPDGKLLARFRKTFFSRFGRNRWTIVDADGSPHGLAVEESLWRALVRKLFGKFHRRYEADFLVQSQGRHAATLWRRADPRGAIDVLEVNGDAIDPRVAVALATLILGSEP